MFSNFKKIISYFPLRYYSASIFFAIFLINGAQSIKDAQEYAIISALHVLNIPAFMSKGDLFVGENSESGSTKIDLPVYVQLLFLMLFPSLAFTVRTNFPTRIKLLLSGFLCFSAFIGVGLGSIVIMSALHIIDSALLFKAVSITASIIVYGVVMYLHVDIDSPIVDYAHLYLFLNLSGVVTFGFFLSNFVFEAKRHRTWKMKRSREPLARSYTDSNRMPSVSFLIPAYNEERLAGGCIASIDKAAAKYDGEVEIIFMN